MYYKYQNIDMYYEKYGTGKRNIIILPGWGNTRKTFDYMINFLKEYATIYIVDYPGFGNTIFPNNDLTIYDYTYIIYSWIKDMNIENPILIGHSFGGRIITTLIGYYNFKTDNIIYLNSAGIIPKRKLKKIIRTKFYHFLKKLSIFLSKKNKKKWNNYLFSKFASKDYQSLNHNMRKTFQNIVNEDLTPYLKNIKTKTLLIWGNKDLSTPIRDAKIMNKLIEKSELIILDNANHFSYLNYPLLVNKIIYEQIKDNI